MSLSEMPLIGCRISIISKAKIRYEGYLHSVDCDNPDEPVITLSKVWSFGTEDRTCERHVAPRNEEYNQVVFRGRDLEDVRLVQSSVFLNEDSAIVSAAPGSTASATQRTNNEDKPHEHKTSVQQPLITPVSTGNISVSHSTILDNFNQSATRPAGSAFHFSPPSSRDIHVGGVGTLPTDSTRLSDLRGPRPFGDGRSEDISSKKSDSHNQNTDAVIQRTLLGSAPPLNSTQAWSNRDHTRGNLTYSRGTYNPNYADQFQRHRGSVGNQWPVNYNRGSRGFQGVYFRRGARFGGWSRQNPGVLPGGSDNSTFTADYDYEKANAELAAELKKLNISSSKTTSSLDGDNSRGEESGSSVADEDSVTYDKNKSFFDTLSSESMDKANGILPQGMNRRDERLLNSATFGTIPNQYQRRGYHNQYHNPRAGFAGSQRRYGTAGGSGGGFRRFPGPNTSRNPYNNSMMFSGAAN